MNIEFVPIQNQHGHLHVRLEKSDFEPKINEKLLSIRKTAHLKGFRQGAAPMGMIQKLYGEQIRVELIDKMLNESVEEYQKQNQISFIGDLLPTDQVGANQILKDDSLEFIFEVGIAPNITLDGTIESLEAEKYKIQIPEDRITEELEHMQDRLAQSNEVDGPVIENDLISIDAVELDHAEIKKDGISSQFMVLVGPEITDEFRKTVMGQSRNHTFDFHISQVEKEVDLEKASTYYLKLDKEKASQQTNDLFRCTIAKISRSSKAEKNEEFFQKAFGQNTEVKNEEEAREAIRKSFEEYFSSEAEKLLDVQLVKALDKKLNLNFPNEFIKKWLTQSFEEWKNKSNHDLEHDLIHFKEAMGWRLIRDKITKDQELKVNYVEIEEIIIRSMQAQYPGIQLPMESWRSLAQKTMENKDRAYEYYAQVLDQKVVNYIKSQIQIKETEISLDDFREKVKAINQHAHHHDHGHETGNHNH